MYDGGSPGNDEQYQYEEGYQEGGDTVTKKLVGSRVARKRAEEDVKLLANRIALLKMEEQKVMSRNSNQFMCRHGKKSRKPKRRPRI